MSKGKKRKSDAPDLDVITHVSEMVTLATNWGNLAKRLRVGVWSLMAVMAGALFIPWANASVVLFFVAMALTAGAWLGRSHANEQARKFRDGLVALATSDRYRDAAFYVMREYEDDGPLKVYMKFGTALEGKTMAEVWEEYEKSGWRGGTDESTDLGFESVRQDDDGDPESIVPFSQIHGVHFFPVFRSKADPVVHTAGGFIDGDWATFTSTSLQRLDGTWIVHRYPTKGNRAALQFLTPDQTHYVEIFSEHIDSVRVAAKGANIAVEVRDAEGKAFVVVGPRGRMKEIFKAMGYPL